MRKPFPPNLKGTTELEMRVVALLILAEFSSVYGFWARHGFLTKTERGRTCLASDAKCIWLNDHLKPHGLPLHSSLCCQCKPEVICYDGPLTIDTLVHMWDKVTVAVRTTKPATLAVTYGNSSLTALSEDAATHTLKRRMCQGSGAEDVVHYTIDAQLEIWLAYPVLVAVGLFLLFTAPSLSRNIPLMYGTGITIGILASLIVLVYILSRYMPGKSFLGLGFLAGGYTIVGGLVYWFLNNMVDILHAYWQYVLGYVVTAGLLSFAVIYYWGGVSNPRAFDLIQWTVQMIACAGIFMGSRLTETSIAMLLLALMTYNVPLRYNPLFYPIWLACWLAGSCISTLCSCLRGIRPSPPIPVKKLLTMEEYDEQGRVETAKALEDLKKYGSTHPEVLDNLNNTSRTRFGKFVRGASGHVTAEEEVNHDWTFMEDSDSDSDNEVASPNQSSSPLRSSPAHSPTSSTPYSHPSTPYSSHQHQHRSHRHAMYYTTPVGGVTANLRK